MTELTTGDFGYFEFVIVGKIRQTKVKGYYEVVSINGETVKLTDGNFTHEVKIENIKIPELK